MPEKRQKMLVTQLDTLVSTIFNNMHLNTLKLVLRGSLSLLKDQNGLWAKPIVDIVRRILSHPQHRDRLPSADLDSCFEHSMDALSKTGSIGLPQSHASIVGNVMLAARYDGVIQAGIRDKLLKRFTAYFKEPNSKDGAANNYLFTAMMHFVFDAAHNDLLGVFNLSLTVIPTLIDMWKGSRRREAPDLHIGVVFLSASVQIAQAMRHRDPTVAREFDKIADAIYAFFEDAVVHRMDKSSCLDARHLILDQFCQRALDPIPFGKCIKDSADSLAHTTEAWQKYTLIAQLMLYRNVDKEGFEKCWETWISNSNQHVPALIVFSMLHRLGFKAKVTHMVITSIVRLLTQHGTMEVQVWSAIALACHVNGNDMTDFDWSDVASACVSGLMVAPKAASMGALLTAILQRVPLDTMQRLAMGSLEVRVPSSPIECHAAILHMHADFVCASLHAMDRQVSVPTELIRSLAFVFLEDLKHVLRSNNVDRIALLDDTNVLECFARLQGRWSTNDKHNHTVRPLGKHVYSELAGWEFRLRDLQDALTDFASPVEASSVQPAASTAGFSRMMNSLVKGFASSLDKTLDATQAASANQEAEKQPDQVLRAARLQIETVCAIAMFDCKDGHVCTMVSRQVSAAIDVALKTLNSMASNRRSALESEKVFHAMLYFSRLISASRLPRVYQVTHDHFCPNAEPAIDGTLRLLLPKDTLERAIALISEVLTCNGVGGKRKFSDDEDEGTYYRTSTLIQDFYGTAARNNSPEISNHVMLVQILSKCVRLVLLHNASPSDNWHKAMLAPEFIATDPSVCNVELLTYFEACLNSPMRLDQEWQEVKRSAVPLSSNQFVLAVLLRLGRLLSSQRIPAVEEQTIWFEEALAFLNYSQESAKKVNLTWRAQMELFPFAVTLFMATVGLQFDVSVDSIVAASGHADKMVRLTAICQIVRLYDAMRKEKLLTDRFLVIVTDQLQQLAQTFHIEYAATTWYVWSMPANVLACLLLKLVREITRCSQLRWSECFKWQT